MMYKEIRVIFLLQLKEKAHTESTLQKWLGRSYQEFQSIERVLYEEFENDQSNC